MNSEQEQIISELERLDAMLFKNEQLFDLASDEAEIDALIYEHRALSIRYSALIAKAKENGIGGGELIWQRSQRSALRR